MRVTYRGPASTLTLANGRTVKRGETADINQATIDALKKARHRFEQPAETAAETPAQTTATAPPAQPAETKE
jgi:hypothetical protein